jgi:hypothetical protein
VYLIAIAWLYVALMMALAEATHVNGTVLGAIVTFLLYGLLPTGLVMYVMGTPLRRKARLATEAQELAEQRAAAGEQALGSPAPATANDPGAHGAESVTAGPIQPHASRHAASAPEPGGVAPVGKPH